MENINLTNSKAVFITSDPWDFVTDYGSNFEGVILQVDYEKVNILFKLDKGIVYKNREFNYFIINKRFKAGRIDEIFTKIGLPSTAYGIPDEVINTIKPIELKPELVAWREEYLSLLGVLATCDIRGKKEQKIGF